MAEHLAMMFECLFSTSVFEVVGGHMQPKYPSFSGKRRLFFGSATACASDVETSPQRFGARIIVIHSLWSCVKQNFPRGPHLPSLAATGCMVAHHINSGSVASPGVLTYLSK
jgi:hypothetical protein